jgi:hypothetical protein
VAGVSAYIVICKKVGEVFESENTQQLVQGLLRMRHQPAAYASYKQHCLAAAIRYYRKYLALSYAGF